MNPNLHQQLLDELMDEHASRSPRENAAVAEILALRERLAELEGATKRPRAKRDEAKYNPDGF